LVTESAFPEFALFNVYFPNGKRESGRLEYKMEFYETILERWQALRKSGRKLIICGTTIPRTKKLTSPAIERTQMFPAFFKFERDWMDKLVGLGYLDVFRIYNPCPTNTLGGT